MEQRRPRLGDIVDDYCPRERRLSNHVVVAMINDEIKQTRCTTCDADHVYKGGKAPARRSRSAAPPVAAPPAIEGPTDTPPADGEPSVSAAPVGLLKPAAPARRTTRAASAHLPPPVAAQPDAAPADPAPIAAAPGRPLDEDEGPVHRPLIRATLPRIEGQTPTRQAPDFTLRLPGARLGAFRDGDLKGQRGPSGRPGNKAPRPHGLHARPHGSGKPGRPNPNGNRAPAFAQPGPGQRRSHGGRQGGKKRTR
jgi:hypothetical protein